MDIGTGLPRSIGRYHIRRLIGHGGMGAVYEAVQEQPRRVVALKVMRHGASSRSALRRFAYEAQVLARLRHPGIAQVFDAGTHMDQGVRVPYFAMEYVPGATHLTEYAEQRDLSTTDRIELFIKVCDAVHHGHQKGIVHRDLKPQNILVDASGNPKIIDFGVARATDSDMAVTTQQTDVGSLVGTIQYMSPEQCAADPHDLDTRSDVYSLAVILYELVCRKLPYSCANQPIPEAVRIVREQAPARPSSVSAFVKGDLEQICLKGLEKDRERRYRSAADFADDLRRYLGAEPVSARRASLGYQLSLFAKRNRVVVIAAGAVFGVLAAGVVISSYLAVQAMRATRELEQRNSLIVAAANADSLGLDSDLATLSSEADRQFYGQQRLLGSIHEGIARAYSRRDKHAEAAREAGVAATFLPATDPKAADRIRDLTLLRARELLADGKLNDAADILTPLVHNAPPNEQLLEPLDTLEFIQGKAQRWDRLEESLQIHDGVLERLGRPGAERIHVRHNLALVQAMLGKDADAARNYESAVGLETAEIGADRDPAATARSRVTVLLWSQRSKVGIAGPRQLEFFELTPPAGARIPAYEVVRVERAMRELISGAKDPDFDPRGGADFVADTKERFERSFSAAAAAANSRTVAPGAARLRIEGGADGPQLRSRLKLIADTMRIVNQLPVGRSARRFVQGRLLDRFRPQGNELDWFDSVVRGDSDPDRALLSAWVLLTPGALTSIPDYDRAETLLRVAATNTLNLPEVELLKGVAMYREGRFDDASEVLRNAAELGGRDSRSVPGITGVTEWSTALLAAGQMARARQLRGDASQYEHAAYGLELWARVLESCGGEEAIAARERVGETLNISDPYRDERNHLLAFAQEALNARRQLVR